MGIIIKHIFKNIFSKPGRFIVLFFCICFASFSALLAFDMANNINSVMKGFVTNYFGDVDILINGADKDILRGTDKITPTVDILFFNAPQEVYSLDETTYNYSKAQQIRIGAFSDLKAAKELMLLSEDFEVDDKTAILTKSCAGLYGVKVGDEITLKTVDEEQIKLKVSKIIGSQSAFWRGDTVVVSQQNLRKIDCVKNPDSGIILLSVADKDKIEMISALLRHNDPTATVTVVQETLATQGLNELFYLFYLMFLISFLVVAFVTFAFSEKIVNERMSVIGTLRSLGISKGKTTFILLSENILYAVIGSALGCVLYAVIKVPLLTPLFTMMFSSPDEGIYDVTDIIAPTPFYIFLAVIAGAVIVVCLYPLFELTRAVKTSIRDIIFNNKDTEFKYRWPRVYIGLFLVIVCVVSSFLVKSFIGLAVSFTSGIVSLALLIPYIVLLASKGLAALFRMGKFPVAQLAAENISRNKIIMGTTVLCVTSMILSILLGSTGAALKKRLTGIGTNADVTVSGDYDEDMDYEFIKDIEGVKDVDYVYKTNPSMSINGEDNTYTDVYKDAPHTILEGFPKDGYDLAEDEAVLSASNAGKYGINAGDTFEVTFEPDSDFPIRKSFRLKDIVEADETALGSDLIVINSSLYDYLYEDLVSEIQIKTGNPEDIKGKLETYLPDSEVKTAEELQEEAEDNANSLVIILNIIVIGNIALTLIGISGNQLIGFINRKREIALLYAVSLSRKRLRRLIFLESLLAMGLSAVAAIVATPMLYNVLINLLIETLGDGGILSSSGISIMGGIGYALIALLVFMLTTLSPFRRLRKMKISEELKYE